MQNEKAISLIHGIGRTVLVLALSLSLYLVGSGCLLAQTSTWNGGATATGGSSWNSASNWSGGTIPNSTTAVALFANPSTAGITSFPSSPISLGAAITVEDIDLTNAASAPPTLTITDATNSLTFDGTGGGAQTVSVNGTGTSLDLNVNTVFENAAALTTGNTLKMDVIQLQNGSEAATFGSSNTVTLDSNVGLQYNTFTGTNTLSLNGTLDVGVGGTNATTVLTISLGITDWNFSTINQDGTGTITNAVAMNSSASATPAILNIGSALTSGGISMGNGSTNSFEDVNITTAGLNVSNALTGNSVGTSNASNLLSTIVLGTNISGGGTGTFSGNLALNEGTGAFESRLYQFNATGSNNTAVFSGQLGSSGSGNSASAFQITGGGTVEFSGGTANGFNSSISAEVMNNTTFELAKTATATATVGSGALTGNVKVDSGSTLELGANNQLGSQNNVTLNGGTFNAQTFSNSSTSGITMGTLTLSLSSNLTVSSGTTLSFANSSGTTWSGDLTISSAFVSGSTLQFGTTSGGLTSAQLADIIFTGADAGDTASLNGAGFLDATAVPEPPVVWLLLGGILLMAASFPGFRRQILGR
jgi:trimeric autotransporter adhesin